MTSDSDTQKCLVAKKKKVWNPPVKPIKNLLNKGDGWVAKQDYKKGTLIRLSHMVLFYLSEQADLGRALKQPVQIC